MIVNQVSQQHTAKESNFDNLSVSGAHLVKHNLTVQKPHQNNHNIAATPAPELLLSPIIFLAMIGGIFFYKLKLLKQASSLKTIPETRCQNCRFFSNNHYLKCTVHPYTVLTEEAINCPDYNPQAKKSSWFGQTEADKHN